MIKDYFHVTAEHLTSDRVALRLRPLGLGMPGSPRFGTGTGNRGEVVFNRGLCQDLVPIISEKYMKIHQGTRRG